LGDDIATPVLQALGPAEIQTLTRRILEKPERLGPEKTAEINWDEFVSTGENTLGVIQDVKTSLEGKKEHTAKVHNILQYINKYCYIVDVAIQHQPQITALVWAGVRTCIQVCALIAPQYANYS
jgi:hypothetical protein